MEAGRVSQQEELDALKMRVRDLEATLGQNNNGIANTFKLTPAMTDLLGLLLALPTVNAEIIEERLGIASNAKVVIHRLRQELKPWGFAIQSKRMLGYWLDPSTKHRIRELLGREALEVAEERDPLAPEQQPEPRAEQQAEAA